MLQVQEIKTNVIPKHPRWGYWEGTVRPRADILDLKRQRASCSRSTVGWDINTAGRSTEWQPTNYTSRSSMRVKHFVRQAHCAFAVEWGCPDWSAESVVFPVSSPFWAVLLNSVGGSAADSWSPSRREVADRGGGSDWNRWYVTAVTHCTALCFGYLCVSTPVTHSYLKLQVPCY